MCAVRDQNAWCINTDKCLDLPAKGIQSASPYCFGLKKDSLKGGEKYQKDKVKVYDRLNQYFDNAIKFLQEEKEKKLAVAFKDFCRRYLSAEIETTEHFVSLKDNDYIIFYLDIPLEIYQKPHQQYLKKRLFNTEQYNVPGLNEEILGTSNFFNGYNSKKLFLMHQTAPFEINGRISGSEAQALFQFEKLIERGVLPNPVPIFIHKEELNLNFGTVKLFHDQDKKIGYREIIQSIKPTDRQNYYLLFVTRGEIKDFDFVSSFEYNLKDAKTGDPFWTIYNLFHLKEKNSKEDKRYPDIKNIFQFQSEVVQYIFNRALVREDEGKLVIKYFDEIDAKYYSAATYLLVMKYRQAFYNYIYKSRREVISGLIFKDIMLTGIRDDVKQNKEFGAKEKLNIYFSLNHHFDNTNSNFNGNYMPDKLDELFQKTMEIADSKERVALSDETEFAYISGQMINFLLDQSESANPTHALLEPFLQKTSRELFVDEIVKVFNRYKHNIDRKGTGRVSRLLREILGFDRPVDIKKYMSFILAGYFSPSFRFTKSVEKQPDTIEK
ncbi:hypothetical protein AHMF7605_16185 [Adhaeribacter arboris]|uniref:Type I-B CRISPR-associated protein Cas8b/Csh1 n=2 Tax=Adhaeribacter arboris TaxID=2072846 RepID=A0A2T2YHF1_9BACT|nr:hypothetical protein AHMF7605_16185 [Adhaeribacter arboris]